MHRMDADPPKLPVAVPVWAPVQVVGRGDREISRIAAHQKGLVIREQLCACGLRRGAIAHRLKNGRLHRRHPGVYLVGHTSLEQFAAEMAAVLYFGGHAILSHRTAALVWGLVETPPDQISLTIVATDRRSRPGLRLHRAAGIDPREVQACHGLPLTSPARTLLDLAGEASSGELEDALAKARGGRLVDDDEIRATINRSPTRRGVSRLRGLLDSGRRSGFTRSKAERRLRALVRAAQLPQPLVNVPLLGYTVDFLWPEERVVLEVDGLGYHLGAAAFRRDRRRDQRLTAAGYLPMRATWDDLTKEFLPFVARLAQALVQGRT